MVTATINGTIGDDLIDVSDLDMTIITDYIIIGDTGNDTIISGGTRDQIFGNKGNDWISSGDGADQIFAGNGNDTVFAGRGDDIVFGGAGDDFIRGGHGNDYLSGGNGNDIIWGDKGRNTIDAGGGDDEVNTGDHTSTVDGGAGNDVITARMKKGADHVLTGGEGADEFVFIQSGASKISDITITDFELGVDGFSVEGVDDTALFLDALNDSDLAEVDGSTVLTVGNGDTITFEGVDLNAFVSYYLTEILVL